MTSTHDTGVITDVITDVITGVVSGSRGIRRVTSMLRILGACAVVTCATASRAPAQQATALTQLDGRVSPALRAQLTTLTDSAFAVGLPVGPLVDKALEGVSKHADDSRIVAAVRAAMTDLGIARRSLGASASEGELTAGVAVLRAGVSASALAAIRRSLPHRPLTVPLSILGALVVQGAPVPSATSARVRARYRAVNRAWRSGRGRSSPTWWIGDKFGRWSPHQFIATQYAAHQSTAHQAVAFWQLSSAARGGAARCAAFQSPCYVLRSQPLC